MTWTLSDTYAPATAPSTTTRTVVFPGGAPAEGTLMVVKCAIANAGANYLPAAPGDWSTAIAPNASTFRTLAVFYKLAGASETNSYDFTILAASPFRICGRVHSSDAGFDALGNTNVYHEAATTDIVSTSVTASANSLVVGFGDSSDQTENNKTFSAGNNPVFFGSTFGRDGAVWFDSSGGVETVTYNIVSGTNTRLSAAIVEFTESSGLELTSISSDDTAPYGENATVVGTNLDTATGFTVDSIDKFSDFDDGDGSTGSWQLPSITDAQQANFPEPLTALTVSITDGVTPDTLPFTFTAPSGKQIVKLAGTMNTTETESLVPHESAFTPAADDYLITDSNCTGGATPAITISAADGTFSFDYSEGTTYTFKYQFWRASNNTLYAAGTVTVQDGAIVSGTPNKQISIGIGIGI